MQYRAFGNTGVQVSTVSFGGNRLGDPGEPPEVWPPVVERALALGVTMFDTSSSYNQGRSESILGQVTARWPSPTVIATKGGVPVETNDFPNRDFSAATIQRDAAASLQRIGRPAIDLYMLHSPTVHQLETQDWAAAYAQLQAAGMVRHTGISTSDHASGVRALRHGLSFLQIDYSILETGAEEELLPLAMERGAGIMVRMPLARGLLTGKFPVGQPISAEQHWRRPSGTLLQTRLRQVEELRFLERPGQTLAQAAIRVVLRHPAVHCAIPGARTVSQLESNVAAADGDLTDAEYQQIRSLQARWQTELC